MNIIITMAGEGSRFQKAGYNSPKHLIEIHGHTLFEWSLHSLKNFYQEPFFFVTRDKFNSREMIEKYCQAHQIPLGGIVELESVTKGQAATVCAAKSIIPNLDDAILIYNIDTYVEPHVLSPEQIKGDGWIPSFEALGDRWSFVDFDRTGRVTDIAEKKRISAYGTIGLYYFSSFKLFEESLHDCSFADCTEQYVAPLYRTLIASKNSLVHTTVLPKEAVHVLGTPEDLDLFSMTSPRGSL